MPSPGDGGAPHPLDRYPLLPRFGALCSLASGRPQPKSRALTYGFLRRREVLKSMKSGKQRRAELKAKRDARAAKQAARQAARIRTAQEREAARGLKVNADALAPNNSYGVPEFVARGYYLDVPFVCQSCGAHQVWTAAQQKWWYEVA